MGQRALWLVLLVLAFRLPVAAGAPPYEVAHTDTGTFLIWHRSPALETDLGMPVLPADATVQDSIVYRVRDRKRFDVARYARVRLSTTQPPQTLVAAYTRALGEVQTVTDATSGEITLSSGVQNDFRLVIITPAAKDCTVRLERVQRFTVPLRVYTPREQRVQRVAAEITRTYRTASFMSYQVDQQPIAPLPDKGSVPTLHWTITFRRPAELTVEATQDGALGLRIVTRDGALVVTHPGKPDEIRPIPSSGLTLEHVPELADDPVACLLLGEELITPDVDYFTLASVQTLPTHQQQDLVLTLPEMTLTLRLRFDLVRRSILHSETLVRADETTTGMRRTYDHVMLAYPTPETMLPSQLQTPPGAPAAVHGL